MKRFITALLAAFVMAATHGQAFAQSQAGRIDVVVSDAASKAPISLARVLLEGPVIATEFTDPRGRVSFVDVPDGIYRARVFKSGYDAVTSAQFEVLEGRAILVAVSLVKSSNLRLIAQVTVHSTAAVSTSSISNDSAQRKLSGDLADALNKLSGVAVSLSSDDSDAQQTISLEGHDPSQTSMTLDGIPLNAPGTAGDMRQFGSDLFVGASVKYGAQVGALGGSVNFRTIEPTFSWLGSATQSAGSNGRWNSAVSESGSAGKLGLAAMLTTRTATSLADGLHYLDASGLDYTHNGDATYNSALLKFRYTLGQEQTLQGSYINSTRNTQLVCLRITGALPCGYGPGNTTTGDFSLVSLTDSALLGDTSVQASLFGNTGTFNHDLTNRFVDGVAQPTGFLGTHRTVGFSINTELPSRQRHTISISANGTTTNSLLTPLVMQAKPYYHGSQQSAYTSLQISDAMRSNNTLTLNEAFGVSGATNAPASLLASLGASWHPNAQDTYSASYSIGGSGANRGRAQTLSDPASLRFDCNGNVAYGVAPGDTPGASSSTSARIDVTHALRKGSLSFSLYRQVQNGIVLPTLVNGSILQTQGVLPPGYLSAVQTLYASGGGCGSSAPFGAQNLYFTTPVSGVNRTYQGARVSAFVTLGRLVVQPYFDITGSTISSNDPRIVNPYSVEIPGSQVPGTPLHRAGITLDYKAPNSSVEWLADAQYVGANNPNNLPAFTTYDLGISTTLARGTLTVAASNISNAFGGTFSSSQNAVPYTALGGMQIATIAQPLAPRTYSATYSVRFGPGANVLPAPRAIASLGKHAPGGRGAEPRRFFLPLPKAAPSDPFALQVNQRCNATDGPNAKTALDALHAYTLRIEAARTAQGYPASMPPLSLTNVTVTYLPQPGATYALAVMPKPGVNLRPLLFCAQVHIARAADVTQEHLYAPRSGTFFRAQLNFMPAIGLYLVAHPPPAGKELFRVYALPTKPPTQAFALESSPECSPALRADAIPLLAELQAHFTSGAATPDWKIVAHPVGATSWYELVPQDPRSSFALLRCARVGAADAAALSARHLGGAALPSLNFAPALGLYLLRRLPPAPPK